MKPLYLLLFGCILSIAGIGQVEIRGTVYDATQKIPLENVRVLSHQGYATTTDSSGTYTMELSPDDSIYFWYGGKATKKYRVKEIAYPYAFDMSLKVKTNYVLPNVTVRARSYWFDSIENRNMYAKAFNFQKPNPLNNFNTNGGVVGLDADAIINMFRFKHTRRMLSLQNRLIQEEQDKYVANRFNKAIVKKITGLGGTALDTFMVRYRPDYYFVQACNDLELYQYIFMANRKYIAGAAKMP